MSVHAVLLEVAGVTAALVGVGMALLWRRGRRSWGNYRGRLREVLPHFAVLGAVLLVNSVARDYAPDVSWLFGVNITSTIYAIEGPLVAWIQSFATPPLTVYFSAIYVYGYVFVLVFPLVAYAALDRPGPLRSLVVAYTLNYALGLACYVAFIAYGPRNFMPDMVESLLYFNYSRFQHVVSEVNRNVNVFPSLHTSLSATVALLARRTRDVYPAWRWVAAWLAASVAASTMYLGIHWATDVVAGVVLAVVCVRGADRITTDTP